MAKFEDEYKTIWAANRTYSYYTGEWYDSELEANVVNFLKLLGRLEFHSQGLVFQVPFLVRGRFKPDVWYSAQPDDATSIGTAKMPLHVGDIKGFKGGKDKSGLPDTNELKRRFLKMQVDDPGDEITRAFWTMRDDYGTLVYDGKSPDWEEGGVCVCPNCGRPFFAVKKRRVCVYCRQSDTKFITGKINGAWVKEWVDVTDRTLERSSELTAQHVRYDPKDVWDEIVAEKEREFREAIRSQDNFVLEKAELSEELKKIDWKSLVRDSYSN